MKEFEEFIKKIISLSGDDETREGLIDTPSRVKKMYEEFFTYKQPSPKITYFNRETPPSLIIDKGYFYSMCEHHIIPFFGDYYFGYIPNKREIGASKIGRTVDYFSGRLQTAERLSYQIIDHIEQVIQPRGLILLMTGRHLCKEMRGLKKHNSPFEVIQARGCLRKNQDNCKDEFINRIGAKL